MAKTFDGVKDPQEIRDFGIDWLPDLGIKTIVSSVWTLVTGTVVLEANSFTTTKTIVRLSGGVDKENASLLNHIVLSSGEELELTVKVKIRSK